MEKIDLKKQLKYLYDSPSKEPVTIDVPSLQYIMVDGVGNPNTSQEYKDAVEALYSVSYTLKFMLKKGPSAFDYIVMPLQGLWWVDDMAKFSVDDKDSWKWTMMVLQPEQVTAELYGEALKQAASKKKLPALPSLRLETFNEGKCAQIMHIGPYSAEKPTIEKLHAYIHGSGGQLAGKHHEIYLSNPLKSAPEKLKTIIRQPFSL